MMMMPDTTSTTLDDRQGQDLLSRLPEEIIETISILLAQHVISLRSTCRELQHKTWHCFSKRFFTSRHVWIDRESLSTLHEIARERRFAQCVMRLTIHGHEFDIRRLRFRVSKQQDGEFNQSYEEVLSRGIEQRSLLQSGAAIEQLSSCMRILPNLTSVSLDLVPPSCEHWPQTHYKRPYGEDYSFYFKESYHDSVTVRHGILLVALQAALQSQQPLTRFESIIPIPADAVALLPPSIFSPLSVPCRTISDLKLSLIPPHVLNDLPLWQKSLSRLLSLCSNLSRLELSFNRAEHGSLHTPILDSLVSWPTYESLRVLHLFDLAVEPEALVGFLVRHFKSLKEIEVDILRADEAKVQWRCVLDSICASAKLDKCSFALHSRGVYDYDDIIDAEGADIMPAVEYQLKDDALWEDEGPGNDNESSDENSDDSDEYDENFDEEFEDGYDPGPHTGNGCWPMLFDGYEV